MDDVLYNQLLGFHVKEGDVLICTNPGNTALRPGDKVVISEMLLNVAGVCFTTADGVKYSVYLKSLFDDLNVENPTFAATNEIIQRAKMSVKNVQFNMEVGGMAPGEAVKVVQKHLIEHRKIRAIKARRAKYEMPQWVFDKNPIRGVDVKKLSMYETGLDRELAHDKNRGWV